jgi:chitodextrinase
MKDLKGMRRGSSRMNEEITSPGSGLALPGPPGIPMVSNATETGIQIKWINNIAGGATGTRVKWALDLDEHNPIGVKDLPISQANVWIEGLVPETKYYLFVSHTNAEGESASTYVSWTTHAATSPPASPTNLTAVPSSNTMTLTWSGPANAISYKIDFGVAPSGATTRITSASPVCTISGLISNTHYYFDVRSSNGKGDSAPTRIVKQTLQVPVAPADLCATPAITTMGLTWSASYGAYEYYIRYGVEPNGPVQLLQTRATTHSLTGLAKNTLYFVEVTAANDNGESLPRRITQKTQDGPPIPWPPGNLQVREVTRDTAQIVWGPPEAPGYKVSYGFDDADRKVIATETTQYFNHTLRQLLPESRYFIDVCGFNASGDSEPASTRATTTKFEAPRDLSLVELTDESGSWNWIAGADYPSETRYEVYLGERLLTTIADTHYRATGLVEKTEYLFKVRAKGAGHYFSGYTTCRFTTWPYRGEKICSPAHLRGRRNTATSALLSWDEPYASCPWCQDTVSFEITGEGIATLDVAGSPCEVKSLDAEREYRFVVRAKAGGNNISSPSHVLVGRRPGRVGALQVGSITSTSARLTWSASGDRVPVFDYVIYCDGEVAASIPGLAYQINHLQAGRTYTVELRARTAFSDLSDPITETFTTGREDDETPPTQPGDPIVSNITSNSATVMWTASTDNVGVVAYLLTLNDNVPITVNGTRHTFDELTPERSYAIEVKATDAAGNCSLPAVVTFQTSSALDEPRNLRETANGDRMVSIAWDAPLGHTPIGYRVNVFGKTIDVRQLHHTFYNTITGLPMNIAVRSRLEGRAFSKWVYILVQPKP